MKVSRCLYCEGQDLLFVAQRLDGNRILKCDRCGLLMTEDLPDNFTDLYGREYFEKPEDTKTGYTNYFSSPAANVIGKYAFARLFSDKPGTHLDLGAADGSLVEIFEANDFNSRGLEISSAAVRAAQTKGLMVSESDLSQFSKGLPKSSLITAFDVLEHLPNLKAALANIRTNLADSGYFIFSTVSVKKNDSTEYWYNTSLEHCVYFTRENLSLILADTFGQHNFAFVELDLNGETQFWGVAKRSKLAAESETLELLGRHSFHKKLPDQAFLFSLLYTQLSLFERADEIIKHFTPNWEPQTALQASFYHNFLQGKFAAAAECVLSSRILPPARNGVFWQALSYAETQAHNAKMAVTVQESNQEIMELREQVFHLRGRVHTLRNYRVIGKLITLREFLGRNYHRAIRLRIRIAKSVRWRLSRVTPKPIRSAIKKVLYYDFREPFVRVRTVANKKWNSTAPMFSVIIPFYNRADTIDDTISSLKAQTYTNFEVIIVDDGSTDQEALDKLTALDTDGLNIKLIHQRNQGPAAARNTGIQKAKGKYILCLDSDDMIEPTAIEKAIIVFETQPSVSIVSYNRQDFGVSDRVWTYIPFDPLELFNNNMVTTAAAFKKEAWRASGGYKSGISYEDWEFWLNLAEHGFWGRVIPETLFKYRISMMSRFVEDKDVHFRAIHAIQKLHSRYKSRVSRILKKRQFTKLVADPNTAFINLKDSSIYRPQAAGRPNILIAIPWMPFGGAENLIYNFCKQISEQFNISFVTGLESDNKWEFKFREITDRIYHLPNVLENEELYVEFVANYVATHNIEVLHVIHNSCFTPMLPDLKRRFPNLKIATTIFNDLAAHFGNSLKVQEAIDIFTTDNEALAEHYGKKLGTREHVRVIPNGLNCYDKFNPRLYNRASQRQALDLTGNDLAVYYIGRLSEEKNPELFIEAAHLVLKSQNSGHIKFFIVGDGPEKKAVEARLKELNNPVIRYLGYSSDVPKTLSGADVFALTSDAEGFPLAILEGMAMNVAVVSTRVGAVPDVIESGEDGIIISPGSESELAAAILKLDQDRKLLHKIQKQGRKKVEEQYSTIALGQNYRQLYLYLLEK